MNLTMIYPAATSHRLNGLFAFLISSLFLMVVSINAKAQQDTTKAATDTTKAAVLLPDSSKFITTPVTPIITFRTNNVARERKLFLQAVRIGDHRTLILTVQTRKTGSIQMSAGNNGHMVFKDGSVVQFTNSSTTNSHPDHNSYGSVINANYQITDSDELLLIRKKLKSIALEFDGGVINYQLNNEQALIFQNTCILIK